MAGEGRFSHLIVISLGDVCIHLYLLQQEARSGYAPDERRRMKGELRVCHPNQHSDPHRPARDPTLHFRFHKIRLYMRKGRLQPDFFDMQADLSLLKRAHTMR